MTIAERSIRRHLARRRREAFCDACLTKQLGLTREEVQRTPAALGETRDFTQGRGVCDGCGQTLIVTTRQPP